MREIKLQDVETAAIEYNLSETDLPECIALEAVRIGHLKAIKESADLMDAEAEDE